MGTTSSSSNSNFLNPDSAEFVFVLLGSMAGVILLIFILICILWRVQLCKIKSNEGPVTDHDNYEHPNSHLYDRFMPRQQPSALQAHIALNAEVNRESVLDHDYAVLIDDDLEMNTLAPAPALT